LQPAHARTQKGARARAQLARTCSHTRVCVYTCTITYIHTPMHTHTHAHTHTHTNTHTHTHTHKCTHTHTHKHTLHYTRTHSLTHPHTHTRRERVWKRETCEYNTSSSPSRRFLVLFFAMESSFPLPSHSDRPPALILASPRQRFSDSGLPFSEDGLA